MSRGILLSLIGVLVSIGIAWGTLSTKQSTIESQQAASDRERRELIGLITEVRDRVTKIETSIIRNERRRENTTR